jgi:putative ABC transport system permease protein
MWLIALRDLQFRRRRFGIAIAATSLVFSMALLLAGFSNMLHTEVRRIVELVGADSWLVTEGTSGPFTAATVLPEETAEAVADSTGVRRADPLIVLHSTMRDPEALDLNVIGYRAGGLGAPTVSEGRPIEARGEVVVDVNLDAAVGSEILVGGVELSVVGRVEGVTYYFATPTVFVSLEDAQAMSFEGAPLATTIVTEGVVSDPPPGLDSLTPEQVRADLARPLGNGTRSIDIMSMLLWFTAGGIIASIIYLSALERTRDFAVLKATGASSRSLALDLSGQAIVIAGASASIGVLLAHVLAPAFPFGVEFGAADYIRLVAIAVVVGVLASLVGARRAVSVDPALAFGG